MAKKKKKQTLENVSFKANFLMKIAFLAPKTISSFFGPSLAKMNVIFLFPVQKSTMGPLFFYLGYLLLRFQTDRKSCTQKLVIYSSNLAHNFHLIIIVLQFFQIAKVSTSTGELNSSQICNESGSHMTTRNCGNWSLTIFWQVYNSVFFLL